MFNLAEEVVTSAFGEAVWDDVLGWAGVGGAYTSLGSYADEEFGRIVAAAEGLLGISEREVVRFVGERALPLLVQRFPDFFTPHVSARSFALTLNEIIHPEVRKLYPGAETPEFDFVELADGELQIGYRSTRRLCSLAEGFLHGAATHYGERVAITRPFCTLDGAESCRIDCRFEHDG